MSNRIVIAGSRSCSQLPTRISFHYRNQLLYEFRLIVLLFRKLIKR